MLFVPGRLLFPVAGPIVSGGSREITRDPNRDRCPQPESCLILAKPGVRKPLRNKGQTTEMETKQLACPMYMALGSVFEVDTDVSRLAV